MGDQVFAWLLAYGGHMCANRSDNQRIFDLGLRRPRNLSTVGNRCSVRTLLPQHVEKPSLWNEAVRDVLDWCAGSHDLQLSDIYSIHRRLVGYFFGYKRLRFSGARYLRDWFLFDGSRPQLEYMASKVITEKPPA